MEGQRTQSAVIVSFGALLTVGGYPLKYPLVPTRGHATPFPHGAGCVDAGLNRLAACHEREQGQLHLGSLRLLGRGRVAEREEEVRHADRAMGWRKRRIAVMLRVEVCGREQRRRLGEGLPCD